MEEVDESIKWIALFMHINIYRPDALYSSGIQMEMEKKIRRVFQSINKYE